MTKSVAAAEFATSAPSLFSDSGTLAQNLVEAYLAVRDETERRAAPLSPEDQLIQSMPDASPAKWHRAHTTWFFEQFLLGEHCEGYQPFHPDYAFLFNSYYVSAGPRHARHQRGTDEGDRTVINRVAVIAAVKDLLFLAEDLAAQFPVGLQFIAGAGDLEDEVARTVFGKGIKDHGGEDEW